jgi:hypothetical protein
LPVLAALNKYGLLEGRGDETRVSDTALAIIAHEPGSPERAEAIKAAAAAPDLFAELDQKFPGGKASDVAIRSYLLTQKFIPAAADAAIRSYRETKQLVESELQGYNPPAGKANGGDDPPPRVAEIGDLVQIESNGALVLEKPRHLRAIRDYEGQQWAFIEGTETGFPMSQVIVEQKGAGAPPGGTIPPRLPEDKPPPKPGMKEEKNSLDEGEAVLIWPENLSADSVRDLEYWLEGILRKAKRRAGITEEAAH